MTDKKKATKKLTPEQYAKAKSMWASGHYTLKAISERFNISIQALQKRFARDGITKGMSAEKHAKAVEKAMEKSIVNEAEETARLIREEKETALKLSEQLKKRTFFEIAKTSKEGLPLAAAESNLKVIALAHKILDSSYSLSSRILGIDRIDAADQDMPVLRIEEMTADDIEEVRQAQREQMDALVEGDLSEIVGDEEEIIVGDEVVE